MSEQMNETEQGPVTEQTAKPAKAKRSWGKRLLIGVGILLGVVIVLIAALPSILSMGAVRSLVVKQVNAAVAPAQVEIADWRFGWWGEQSVQGIRFRDETKGLDAQVEAVRLSSLWSLLPVGKMTVDVTVEAPTVTTFTPILPEPAPAAPYYTPSTTPTPSATVAESQPSAPAVKEPITLPDLDLSAHVVVRDASFSMEGMPKPLVAGVNVELTVPSLKDDITASLKGRFLDMAFSGQATVPSATTLVNAKAPAELLREVLFKADAPWLKLDTKAKGAEGKLWPEATVTLNVNVPKTLAVAEQFGVALPPDVAIQGGDVTVKAEVRNAAQGEALEASADLAIEALKTRYAGKDLQPLSARVAAERVTVDLNNPLASAIGNLTVDVPGVSVQGGGNLEEGRLAVQVDSEQVLAVAKPFIGEVALPGPVSLSMEGAAEKGTLALQTVVDSKALRLAELKVAASGIDITQQAVEAFQVSLTTGLPAVAKYLSLAEPQIHDGTLTARVNGSFKRETLEATVTTDLTQVDILGPTYRLKEAEMLDVDIALAFAKQVLDVKALSVKTPISDLSGTARYALGKPLAEAVSAQLKGWVKPEHAMLAWVIPKDLDNAVNVKGTVDLEVQATPSETSLTIPTVAAKVTSKDLAVVLGKMRPIEAPLELSVQAGGTGADYLLQGLSLQMPYVGLTANGGFTTGPGVVTMRGTLTPDFEAIWTLPFLDQVREQGITVSGKETRPFTVELPVKGGVEAMLAQGHANLGVAFARVVVPGLDIPKGEATVTLADGQVRALAEVAMNGGLLRVAPVLVQENGTWVVSIPEDEYILKDFGVTEALFDAGLGLVNPILKGSASPSGTISVQSKRLRMALDGANALQTLDLAVALKTSTITLKPNGTLGEILQAVQAKKTELALKPQEMTVQVEDGILATDKPIEVAIGDRVTLQCQGKTNLTTRALDYTLSVPLAELLREKAKVDMGERTIVVPITGTIEKPVVDTSALTETAVSTAVDVGVEVGKAKLTEKLNEKLNKERAKAAASKDPKKAAKAEAKAEAIDAGLDLLSGLLSGEEAPADTDKQEQKPSPKKDTKQSPGLDALRGLLGR